MQDDTATHSVALSCVMLAPALHPLDSRLEEPPLRPQRPQRRDLKTGTLQIAPQMGAVWLLCREGKPAVLSSSHVCGASSQLFELPLKHEQAAKCHQIFEACFTVKGRGREVHLEAFELIRGWRTSGRGSRSQRKKDAVPIK